MVFSDLRMGDYFSLDGKPYMRLQEYIMSLDKDFFGIVYTTPVGSYQVEFLSSFEYKSSPYIAVDLNIDPNNVPIDKAPCNALLQSVNTNDLYVKIKDLYGTGFPQLPKQGSSKRYLRQFFEAESLAFSLNTKA